VFAARGYHGASIDLIAAEAGLSKGAVYWNFDTKEELFVGLLEDRFDRRARGLMAITERASSDEVSSEAVSRGFSQMVDEHRRDEKLRKRWAKRQRALREDLARALVTRHETTGVPLSVPASELATAILAMADGLAMDMVAEPDAVSPELFGTMLALLYDGLAFRAGAGP